MKKKKVDKDTKATRPPRAVMTAEEALKRMKEFPKRREQFLATARTVRVEAYIPELFFGGSLLDGAQPTC